MLVTIWTVLIRLGGLLKIQKKDKLGKSIEGGVSLGGVGGRMEVNMIKIYV